MSTADMNDADKTGKHVTHEVCALVEAKEELKEPSSDSLKPFIQETVETQNTAEILQATEEYSQLQNEVKYKEEKRDLSSSFYSTLPETREIQFAREMTEIISEAKYKQALRKALTYPSYFQLTETPETQHAKKVSQLQSKNKYKEESKTEMPHCLYSLLSETTESQFAKSVSNLVSETKYKQKANERVSNFLFSHLPQPHEMQLANEIAEIPQNMDKTDFQLDMSSCLYSQLPETIQTRFAKELSSTLSEYQYKQEGKKDLANCLYALLPETRETQHAKELSQLYSKKSYKEGGKKDAEACLYAQMPQTIETVFAKEVTNHQSNKLYKEKYNAEKGKSIYASMKTLPEVERAMEVNKEQSNVAYRKGIQQVHKFHEVADRPDILSATKATQLASNVAYKNKVDTFNEQALLQRSDIEHAMKAAKAASTVQYQQKFQRDLKDQKPTYNPSDCVSFKHAQAASALISQVKYRQDYEKNKGKLKMEFAETQFYRVSKEAQKMQSKKEYHKEYENRIKGKVQMDLELTPGFLIARSANMLLSEKEYRKDLKKEIIGKRTDIGMDAMEIQRALKTSEITSQKKYKDNTEKCSYAVMPDTPEIERVKINQHNISSVRYSWNAKHMKRLTTSVTDTPEIVLAKENTKKISNVQYKEEVGSGISVKDTLEMERVRRNQMNISSAKYRKDFEQTRGRGFGPAWENKGVGQQVWRTDPGSIFDFDPVEDNIQSRSLRRMSDRPNHVSRQQLVHSMPSGAQSVCSLSVSEVWGGESVSSLSTLQNTPSTASVISEDIQQSSQCHQTGQPTLDIMGVYYALYDYAAQDHDEVSFQDGDVIINVQPVDEGWMYGTVKRTGQAGMLPANYVKCLSCYRLSE